MESPGTARGGSTALGRLSRFGDWAELSALCQSGTSPGGRPYFTGENVYNRMGLIRQAINDIRTGWDQYPSLMQDLREYLSASVEAARDKQRREGLWGARTRSRILTWPSTRFAHIR
jgi:hypothetical protein